MTSKNSEDTSRRDATRILFLEEIIGFVRLLVKNCELYNFNGFSFYAKMGRNIGESNELILWHHPGHQYEDGLIPVLVIAWYISVGNNSYLKFNEDPHWQREIQKMMGRKVVIIPTKKVLTKYQKDTRERHLVEKEKRLERRLLRLRLQGHKNIAP